LRSLAIGSSVATFGVVANVFRGSGEQHGECHSILVWDRLAQVCGQYLGKGLVSTLAPDAAAELAGRAKATRPPPA